VEDPNEHELDLQLLLTSGPEAPERAVLALAAALSAAHSKIRARVVLAMRGAIWAAEREGNVESVAGYPPVGELIAMIVEDGGSVVGCSSCIDQFCPAPIGDDGLKILRGGITREGLSAITIRMTQVPTVTF
jgi:predicted peroxiredoxin